MNNEKYIGLDVHQATVVVAVRDSTGKLVMESIVETEAATLLQFFAGLRGTLAVTFEEGTWAAWLYDLLKPHVDRLVVCNPRKKVRPPWRVRPGPFQDFYQAALAKGIKPTMARLTLARKIAAITLTLWKKGENFDAEKLKSQAA